MLNPSPTTIYLKDYAPPAFLISAIELDVDLQEDFARVRARLAVHRNPQAVERAGPLVLNGDELELESVALDGRTLTPAEYELDDEHLTVAGVPERFTLETVVRIRSAQEHQADGLVRLQGRLLHAVRGGRLPAHHLLHRPPGRDGALHHHHPRRQGPLPVPAVERQSGRLRGRARAREAARRGTG